MKVKYTFIFLAFVIVLAACSATKSGNTRAGADKELEDLEALLKGEYSSELQAKKDSDYFHISLVMVPIWTNRTDGKWLYVEQALATKLDKPYRQRVYNLQHPSKNIFTSDIYTIQDALSFAGAQKDQEKMNKLTFDKIEKKDGCTVTLNFHDTFYEGGTDGSKCPSDLRGAKYATTKIKLIKGELDSWDQGFDSTGKQVWGATKGGYIFIKK